jgi:hypothetical protein
VLADNVVANCDSGQSLNIAISKLNKQIPNTVTIQGTCMEYVTIARFENLSVSFTTTPMLSQGKCPLFPKNVALRVRGCSGDRSRQATANPDNGT